MKQYRPYVDARFAGLVSSPCDARPPPAGCRVLQEATMAVLPPARPVGPAWLAACGRETLRSCALVYALSQHARGHPFGAARVGIIAARLPGPQAHFHP
jgi:hypothetical protein